MTLQNSCYKEVISRQFFLTAKKMELFCIKTLQSFMAIKSREKCNYDPKLDQYNKIRKRFIFVKFE